jgi:hypothetical protein
MVRMPARVDSRLQLGEAGVVCGGDTAVVAGGEQVEGAPVVQRQELGRGGGGVRGREPLGLEHRHEQRDPVVDDSAQEGRVASWVPQRCGIDLEEEAQVGTRARVRGARPEPPHPIEEGLVRGDELADGYLERLRGAQGFGQ